MTKTLSEILAAKKSANETIITPYIMAGDHEKGIDGLPETIDFLQSCGAAAIEIGIPFSDPVADGEVIQEAGLRALAKGTSIFSVVKKLQEIKCEIPLVIMSYFNPIYNYGVQKFVADLRNTDVKGLIVPDMPFEHDDFIAPFLQDTDIALIRLLSLTTPRERQETLAKSADGFIYAVAINGITGTSKFNFDVLSSHLSHLTAVSPIPVLAGFGVSSVEHIKNFRKFCDGVIIGSFIVKALHNGEFEKVRELFAGE